VLIGSLALLYIEKLVLEALLYTVKFVMEEKPDQCEQTLEDKVSNVTVLEK